MLKSLPAQSAVRTVHALGFTLWRFLLTHRHRHRQFQLAQAPDLKDQITRHRLRCRSLHVGELGEFRCSAGAGYLAEVEREAEGRGEVSEAQIKYAQAVNRRQRSAFAV